MIRLEALRVEAGGFTLSIDDLVIASGEYVMVLGPTASGKTMLLETVAGLRRPHEGRVWFAGRDVTNEPPERRGAGLVYQDYALFPHLTVAGNIGFGVGSRGEGGRRSSGGRSQRERRVRDLAELLDIGGLLDRYPAGLSGGEQQRVALARALAIEPEVLLLDEPLSALDGPTRLELQKELGRLHRELGATVLHVTHDLDEALALGNRVAVLMGGRLRQVGIPAQVTRFPADAEVARLAGMANVYAVETWDGGGGVRLENGLELAAEAPPGALEAGRLCAVLRADDIEIEPSQAEGGAGVPQGDWSQGPRGGVSLQGVVRAVHVQSVHCSVEVGVLPGVASPAVPMSVVEESPVIAVYMLRPQVDRLHLAAGSRVRLRIPASAVHLCAERAAPA